METFIIKPNQSELPHAPFQRRLSAISVKGMGSWRGKCKLPIKLSTHKMWYAAIVSTETSKWIAEL